MASSHRPNGVLQVPVNATQKTSSIGPVLRPVIPRLKTVIRRLPPGLTQHEFEATLGDEWKVGGEKVNWMSYKDGKQSKEYCGSYL